jgi:hypothetical protein
MEQNMEARDASDLNEISAALSYLREALDVLRYDTRNTDLCNNIRTQIKRSQTAYSHLATKLR